MNLYLKTVQAELHDWRRSNSFKRLKESFQSLDEFQIPQHLVGDENRLRQIMMNLIKNAIKFTVNGEIIILISYDAAREQLVVQVGDSGKGIRADEIPKLCSKFGTLFRTAEQNSEGIGLGLMVSKALIEGNSGELRIESEGM